MVRHVHCISCEGLLQAQRAGSRSNRFTPLQTTGAGAGQGTECWDSSSTTPCSPKPLFRSEQADFCCLWRTDTGEFLKRESPLQEDSPALAGDLHGSTRSMQDPETPSHRGPSPSSARPARGPSLPQGDTAAPQPPESDGRAGGQLARSWGSQRRGKGWKYPKSGQRRKAGSQPAPLCPAAGDRLCPAQKLLITTRWLRVEPRSSVGVDILQLRRNTGRAASLRARRQTLNCCFFAIQSIQSPFIKISGKKKS